MRFLEGTSLVKTHDKKLVAIFDVHLDFLTR